MESKEKKFSKKFHKEPLFKKYFNKTWKDAQDVSEETIINYIFIIIFRLDSI